PPSRCPCRAIRRRSRCAYGSWRSLLRVGAAVRGRSPLNTATYHDRMSATAPPEPAWIRHAICWQVYPMGFCGAPLHRDDPVGTSSGEVDGHDVAHRLPRLLGWLDHLASLGANVLLLNPVFDSVSHGYDTLDHRRIDPRLGDDEDFDA